MIYKKQCMICFNLTSASVTISNKQLDFFINSYCSKSPFIVNCEIELIFMEANRQKIKPIKTNKWTQNETQQI